MTVICALHDSFKCVKVIKVADTCPSDDQRLHEEHESSKDMAITPIEREHKGHRTVLKANYKESNRRLIAFLSKRKGQRKEIKGEEE